MTHLSPTTKWNTKKAPRVPYGQKVKQPKKQNEGAVVKQCIDWLFAHGCYVWRNNTGAYRKDNGRLIRYGKVGSGDIQGLTKNGRYITIECKAGRNDLSDHQERFRDEIIAHNGIHITAYSLDDLIARQSEITNQP